ncbi:MAG: peptidase T [Bacteroidales bacterium]|nr:peptidase T [Bacteroidales bacterium]
MKLKERFFKYIAVDTQSAPESATFPSTAKQKDFARTLVEELHALGVTNAAMDEYGYVMASIPANTKKTLPTIGFIAHMDTAPDLDGRCTRPQVVENYQGQTIPLDAEGKFKLSPEEFPEMLQYKGQTLICTSGDTLLGADDKAGITEIMCAVEHLLQHPEVEHGPIAIGFTPDEEIGCGVDHFDVEKFGADYAYTMDGGQIGELEYENFNAAGAKLHIQGLNVHPGYAKGKMLNAQLVAMELHQLLPVGQRPELTQDYEGFFLLTGMNGSVEEAKMQYIIRDHDRRKFEEKKALMQEAVNFLNRKYGDCIQCELKDQYYNMREQVEQHKFIVDIAEEAIRQAGVEPKVVPIRGGTDGARLSFMGLPCPNLFAGGHNFHGRYEYVILESMEKAVQVILNIVTAYAKRA